MVTGRFRCCLLFGFVFACWLLVCGLKAWCIGCYSGSMVLLVLRAACLWCFGYGGVVVFRILVAGCGFG